MAFLAQTSQTVRRGALRRVVFRFRSASSKACPKIARLWLLLLLTGSPQLVRADDAVSKEYQVKAAFLYNFGKFVEWPAAVMPNGKSPILIGVYGKSPFGDELQQIVKGKTINERPVEIQLAQIAEQLRNCHLVFVSSGEDKRLPELFAALKGAHVLTVGESKKFAELGGTINFVQEDGKLRFEIDGDSAGRAGLRISAQLLKLAKTVRGAREVGEKR